MTTAPSAPSLHGAKKKKSKKRVSEDVPAVGHPPATTTEDGGISQAIQNALDHVRASEAIATSSSSLATPRGEQPATETKKRPNPDNSSPTVEP
ncbi:hypothetical protein FRC08_008876, partial [Ceratobasidium sp. 394]